MRGWRRGPVTRLHECRIFDLTRVRFEAGAEDPVRDFYVIESPDWVNIIPVTEDEQVVLVRQYRFGVGQPGLEVPGGMCDGNEPPLAAAIREMREETGYEAREVVPLGWVHPNPAVQNNRCHSFLARGARAVGSPTPDAEEEIEVELVPLTGIPDLIATGEITHSLVVAAFHLMALRA